MMAEIRLRMGRLEWALMMQESSSRPHMVKEDGRLRAALSAKGLKGDELDFQCRSWGLWQLRGCDLRELGFTGDSALLQGDVSLQLDYMRRKWSRDTDARDAQWLSIEHWNLHPLDQGWRNAPGQYYRGVSGWMRLRKERDEMDVYFRVAA